MIQESRRLATALTSWLGLLVLVAIFGCKPQPSTETGTASAKPVEARAGMTADQILKSVQTRYQQAASYRDQGVLELSYRMQGQSLCEPKRFQTTFLRAHDSHASGDQVCLDWYNTQVRGDGKQLVCRVYDIETANLDNQCLVIPYSGEAGAPLGRLVQDQIARHFLAGFSELPLNPEFEDDGPMLLPPAVSLLRPGVRNRWLQTPDRVERLPNEKLGDVECLRVRTLAHGLTCDVWIEPQGWAIVQMSFPIRFLADEVVASEEVTEVVLKAKFHDVQFDVSVQDADFAADGVSRTTPVRKFVSLPAAMPSGLIGETVPRFQLPTSDGQTISHLSFDQKTTALIWLGNPATLASLHSLKSIQANLDSNKYHVGLLYSELTADPASTSTPPAPSDEVKALADQLQLPLYFDSNFELSTAWKINLVPAVAVLDGDSRLQFVASVEGDRWSEELQVAMQRVSAGDHLADEMKADYAGYLDRYHQQLQAVSARALVRNTSPLRPATSTGGTPWLAGSRLAWTQSNLKQPGNLLMMPNRKLAVFDGWQTVRQLDATGQIVSDREYQLPAAYTASQFRRLTDNGDRLGLFSARGDVVQVLDAAWQSVGQYQSGQAILDLLGMDANGDGQIELLISVENEGVKMVDAQGGQAKAVTADSPTALLLVKQRLIGLSSGQLRYLDTGDKFAQLDLEVRKVWPAGNDEWLAVAVDHRGKWSASGLDSEGQPLWSLEIGSPLFETAIDPVANCDWQDARLWAIADAENRVQLVTTTGQWLGEVELPQAIRGLALEHHAGQLRLITSHNHGVECRELDVRSGQVGQAARFKDSR